MCREQLICLSLWLIQLSGGSSSSADPNQFRLLCEDRPNWCVFKFDRPIEKAELSARNFGILPDVPCMPGSCSGNSRPCQCCDLITSKVRKLLDHFVQALGDNERAVSQVNSTGNDELNPGTASTVLIGICTRFHCTDHSCEHIVCNYPHAECKHQSRPTTTTASTGLTLRSSLPISSSPSGIESTSKTTMTSSSAASSLTGDQNGSDVTAVVVGCLLVVLVAAGVVVFIVWWRRKKATKEGLAKPRSSTVEFVVDEEADSSPYSEISDVDRRHHGMGSENGKMADYRVSEHEYNYIQADLVGVSPTRNGQIDNAGYDVAGDVTKRKLPSAPAQDGDYSLAKNPPIQPKETQQPLQPSAPQGEVYSLASATQVKLTSPRKKPEVFPEGQEKDGQYFVLEENAAGTDEDETKDGQYFVLEDDSGTDDAARHKDGQYIILEQKRTKPGGTESSSDGQYFVLEDDVTQNDANVEGTASQYFILEEAAEGSDPTGGNSRNILRQDSEYSTLDRADMVQEEASDEVYTALDQQEQDDAGKPTESFSDFDSDYSLQKPI